MEIKAKINKPFSDNKKMNFIVEYNHKLGFEIQETPVALEAWGCTEEELQTKERERIQKLKLTKREVFLALYKLKGITPDEIKSKITDIEALIEFEYANEYYRGNPLIDEVGLQLGLTSEQLDYLFENKTFLISSQKEPENVGIDETEGVKDE